MKNDSVNTHAMTTAGVVCSICVLILLYVWMLAPIPDAYLRDVLFVVILFGIAIITVGVYQSLRLYENAEVLAVGMTQNILMNSKELFFELYQKSPVPYITIDDKGIVESVNYSIARLFNMETDAFQGINIFDFLKEVDSHKLELVPEYFHQGKFINDMEICIQRPDGETPWVMFSLYSFKDGAGAKKGLLTLVDITKQKQIDKAKSEFVSLASHQLRTPLAGIRWNIELLESVGKDSMNDVEKTYVEKISNGLARMDMLVNDFLNVSKFELGTLTAQLAPLDLFAFLQTILDEQAHAVEKKGLHIETEWDESIGTVRTDSHLLHMIVSNLLSNAIKYTPIQGVVRSIVSSSGTNVVLKISDTGIGIPKDEHDLIFSKVFRASNTQQLAVEGTGLGLYIVKEAVHVLGGTISFESEEGKGTTFTVILPK
jgi:PAS domain S-box-containing protein